MAWVQETCWKKKEQRKIKKEDKGTLKAYLYIANFVFMMGNLCFLNYINEE